MKTSRQIQKDTTYSNIIDTTKKLIIKKGVLNLSTIEIAKEAGVAHGTVFSHFENKDILIETVFNKELYRIANELNNFKNDKNLSLDELLLKYLDFIVSEEELFTIIAKEFPFYSKNIKNTIIANEIIIKNMIIKHIVTGIKNKIYDTNSNPTIAVMFLFSTINNYLNRKELYTKSDDSIISHKKNDIVKLFLKIIT